MPAVAAPIAPTCPDPGPLGALSAGQAKAALALAYGGTVSAAADSAGVHRSSIYSWFKSDPNFKQAVEEIRRDRNERLVDQMREIESLALARLRRLIEDDSVPASVQLRAALAILNRPKPSLGIEEWNVPSAESLEITLKRKPHVAEPPKFDTARQISTLFAVSGARGSVSDTTRQISTLFAVSGASGADASACPRSPTSGSVPEPVASSSGS
jgi:AcrR family transcriptional regulator